MKKLTVHLVTWNGAKYIPYLFDSLRKQTYTDWTLYILDNGSSDDTVIAIKKELQDVSFDYEFIEAKENTGFAGGHNMLYQQTKSDYFLLLNQDMYLSTDCFEQLVGHMDDHTAVASVSPRLMRWHFNKIKNVENVSDSFTDDIDALGLQVFRSRRVVEMRTGYQWTTIKDQYPSKELNVFGVSGAFPLYRRSAIDTVAFDDTTFFDASYQSYKEDVDLAFRLQSHGYKSHVLLFTFAYHDRSGSGVQPLHDKAASQNKKAQSSLVKYYSYKNHLITLVKNEYGTNFLFDFPWIIWYELKKFVWFLLFDRAVFQGIFSIDWKDVFHKRKIITEQRKHTYKDMRIWWTNQ